MRSITISVLILVLMHAVSFAQSGSIPVDGTNRDFTVYVPSSGLPENPPLVLALHALGQTASQFRNSSGYDAIADEEKIVVVYPVGTYKVTNMGNMIGWDIYSEGDVKFLSALIDTLAERFKIDRNRVYSTGFSMGGMMSYKLASSISDKIAAIGPDAGYPVGVDIRSFKPTNPVPVCHVHGADDDFVNYSGVGDWIKKFAELNGCQENPATTNPSSKAKKEDWGPCEDGNDVIFYSVAGMGHDYATSSKYDFSATDTIWAFFKAHSRGGSTNIMEKPLNTTQHAQNLKPVYSGGVLYLTVKQKISLVRVFDVQGKLVFRWRDLTGQCSNRNVPVGHMSRGVYIIKATGSSQSSIGQILIP